MNMFRIYPRIAHWLARLALASALVYPASGARLVEETFPVLKTRTGTYTNVTVTTKAEKYIFILHKNGMTSLKIAELPIEVQRQLGYAEADPMSGQTNSVATVAAREPANKDPNSKSQKANWQLNGLGLNLASEALLTTVAFALIFHFFFSYCCNLICMKANGPKSFLVWVPVLQIIPLLQAAGMSGLWLLIWPIGYFVWAVNIVKAREKNIGVAILLMLPFTCTLAFLYLAFSSAAASDAPPKKFQATALQTA